MVEMIRNRDDFDALYEQMAPFARQQKCKYGDMMPFAMTLDHNGVFAMVGSLGEDTYEVLSNLRLGLTRGAQQGEFKAVGLCYDGVLKDSSGAAQDALFFEIEHQTVEAVTMCIPYTTGLSGDPQFGKPGRMPAKISFFAQGDALARTIPESLPPKIEAGVNKLLDSYCQRLTLEELSLEGIEIVADKLMRALATFIDSAASGRTESIVEHVRIHIVEELKARANLR